MTDLPMILLTLVIAIFTALVWRVYERIAALTQAMESHTTLMLRIEAKKEKIPVIWWDPTLDGHSTKTWPIFEGEHGKEATLKSIYIGIPLANRKHQPSCCSAIRAFLGNIWACLVSVVTCWHNPSRRRITPAHGNQLERCDSDGSDHAE